MGYSGRYHAASLVAVFIALAVGILIGIGLADDVVSSASEELETSLRQDLQAAEDRADELQGEIDRDRRFSDQVLPAVVGGRLAGRRVALIEFGDVPDELSASAREAVETAGGELAAVAGFSQPPDPAALAGGLSSRFDAIRKDPDVLAALGRALGRQLVGGGPLLDVLKPELFAFFSGDLRGVNRVVVSRVPADDLEPAEEDATAAFEEGLLEGIDDAALATVGAELSTSDPGTLDPFIDAGIPTVDDLDLPAGKVSLVFALDGLEGNFGIKEGAQSYLPDFERGSAAASP